MKTGTQITILVLAVVLAFGSGYWLCDTANTAGQGTQYLDVEGQRIPLIKGANIRITKTKPFPPAIARTVSGRAKGGDYASNAGTWSEKFAQGAPTLENMNGASGSGGELAYAAVGLASRGPVVLIGVGIVLLIGGVIVFAYWNKRLGLYMIIAGGLVICIAIAFERWPWLAVAIPVVAIGGLVIWWYYSRKAGQESTTLKTVVKGVEKAEPKPGPVKASIADVAKNTGTKDTVKAVVGKVKAESGIPGDSA